MERRQAASTPAGCGPDASPAAAAALLEDLSRLLKAAKPRASTRFNRERRRRVSQGVSRTDLFDARESSRSLLGSLERHRSLLDRARQRDEATGPVDPFQAVAAGEEEALRVWVLLQGGGPRALNRVNRRTGRTLLHCAASAGHEGIVRLLLSYLPTEVNQLTLLGRQTALHLAAAEGHNNVVRVLLDKGADPRMRNALGEQPLHLASDALAVRTLLSRGADPLAKTRKGLAPSQCAAMRGDAAVYDALEAAVKAYHREERDRVRQVAARRRDREETAEKRHASRARADLLAELKAQYQAWRS